MAMSWLVVAWPFILAACWALRDDPSPNPQSVVKVGKARFTILTDHLVRMEWGDEYVDAATFSFINRNLVKPDFSVTQENGWIVIMTSAVQVRFLPNNASFNEHNLQVSILLNGEVKTWSPMPALNTTLNGNLLGTIRTLDGAFGPRELNCFKQEDFSQHCQFGLISTEGYVVVDDSGHPQFSSSQWPWLVNQSFPHPSNASCTTVPLQQRMDCGSPGISEFDCHGKGCCYDPKHYNSSPSTPNCFYTDTSYKDLYFLGYGHDYKLALKEFTMVSGKIPLPPRYAFGIFFSRYWAYSDIGEMDIVHGYESRNIPLDVLVTDMDWHITFYNGQTDQAGEQMGWTGFTFDKHLFPNPKQFLEWCKRKGLKNTLNLHPASGIQPWEETYAEMAEAMGIDPSSKKYVPFDPTDLEFVTNWFKIVLGPLEQEGIDFWWLDWQQGEDWIKIPMANPTIWLNYLFFTNSFHWNLTNPTTRPFLLHRWGGLGNHRYQVGFSGDVGPEWDSLDFQVNFTLRATNVLFGYWSHDIGGHKLPSPPELYTRWVQWGAFSPMFRTHCTKNALNDRRIWIYPTENFEIMRRAILMRAALVPYIYTYARYAHDHGLSLLRPMYYEYPEVAEAYSSLYDRQYFFGPDILVAPITEQLDPTVNLTSKAIWIPEGHYISWVTGELIKGPVAITRSYSLSEMAIFVKVGSVIPMRTDGFSPIGSTQEVPNSLKFVLFVGNTDTSGSGYVYEDDGKTVDYMSAKYSNTTITFTNQVKQSALDITIGAAEGNFTGQPPRRNYQIAIPSFWPADSVVVDNANLSKCYLMDSFEDYVTDCWSYDGSTLTLLVNIVTFKATTTPVKINIAYKSSHSAGFDSFWVPGGFAGRLGRLVKAKEMLDDQWGIDTVYQEDYPNLLKAAEIGQRITYNCSNIVDLARNFTQYDSLALNEVANLKSLDNSIKHLLLVQLTSF